MLFRNKKNIFVALVLLAGSLIFADTKTSGVERFALYIGCNNGGKSNARLMYAGTDASSFQKTMSEIGGVPNSNSILLIDPTKDDVDNALNAITDAIARNSNASRRSEFIFYYSGHSSETALLLGKTTYDYTKLKESISKVPSDVHVVILDSCYSGNFIRTKGGSRQKPFLVDDSTVVKGHAYLSSSSTQETSQESDEIGSSFFTNAVLTGLRGAADTSGDKKVTLNELYSYAFNETLSKTEDSASGPQHPNYNITLVGSGDLVLSDISTSECLVKVSKETDGRVIIRNNAGKLVSEVQKSYGNPVYLALERGRYSATVITENETYQGNFDLSPSKVYVVETKSLSAINRTTNRTRGGSGDDEGFEYADLVEQQEKDTCHFPFVFSFVGNEFFHDGNKNVTSLIALGLLRSGLYGVKGIQASGITNYSDFVYGAQGAGVFNITTELKGVQGAGVFNIADDFIGAQGAGVFNIAKKGGLGAQGAGLFNIGGDMRGAQGAGFLNYAHGILGAQGAGFLNIARDTAGVQAAGFANLTFKNVKGIQAAGFFNYAGSVQGVQAGIVNICSGNCYGVQLGLFNYSKNGVCEFGLSYTTENNLRFTFSTGSKYVYSIFGYSADIKCFNPNVSDSEKYGHLILGLGTRLTAGLFNFDFEVLGNEILHAEKTGDSNYNLSGCWYPSLRFGLGFTPVKHVKIFAGAAMGFEIPGNNEAFEYKENNIVIETSDSKVKFHPEFDFGLKISLN